MDRVVAKMAYLTKVSNQTGFAVNSRRHTQKVVVGEGARGIADGALAAGMHPDRVHLVADRDEALAVLLTELDDGDSILVKASRGAELDRLVERLAVAGGAREARA